MLSLSLCTLETNRLLSLCWPIVALSHGFSLRIALKLLSASHEDAGATNKIMTRTSTWSNSPRTSTGILLRTSAASLLLRKRGNCTARVPLCNSGYLSTESVNNPVKMTFSKLSRDFRLTWLTLRQTEPPHKPILWRTLLYNTPLLCPQNDTNLLNAGGGGWGESRMGRRHVPSVPPGFTSMSVPLDLISILCIGLYYMYVWTAGLMKNESSLCRSKIKIDEIDDRSLQSCLLLCSSLSPVNPLCCGLAG